MSSIKVAGSKSMIPSKSDMHNDEAKLEVYFHAVHENYKCEMWWQWLIARVSTLTAPTLPPLSAYMGEQTEKEKSKLYAVYKQVKYAMKLAYQPPSPAGASSPAASAASAARPPGVLRGQHHGEAVRPAEARAVGDVEALRGHGKGSRHAPVRRAAAAPQSHLLNV